MSRSVIIESECVVDNLNFPRHLDHAWLFLAAGIHARLYNRSASDQFIPWIVESFKESGNRKYHLVINERCSWSDDKPILAKEVAVAMKRGARAGLFSAVRVLDHKCLEVTSQNEADFNEDLLSSPLFTLTPCCRDTSNTLATCGKYQLIFSSKDRRLMTFRKRNHGPIPESVPEEITIFVTENREQGLRLLHENRITLSCPLGCQPEVFARHRAENTIMNRLSNLAVILRPYPNCSLAHDPAMLALIANALDRESLAAATESTFAPLPALSSLFGSRVQAHTSLAYSRLPTNLLINRTAVRHRFHSVPLELRYAEFEPNRRIANEIRKQLRQNLNIDCKLMPVSYTEYVASRFPQGNGISLEIIQPYVPESVVRSRWNILDEHFLDVAKSSDEKKITYAANRPTAIPLLRAQTTQISLCGRYSERPILTAEAIHEWSNL